MKRLFTLSALLLFFAYPLCAQGGRSGAIVKAGKAALSHKPILELPKIQTHTHFTLSNGITTSVVPNLSNVTAAPTAGLTATTLSNLPGATAAKPTVAPQGPSFRNRQMERFAAPISPEQSARITQTLIRRVQTSSELFEQVLANSPTIHPQFSPIKLRNGIALSQNLTEPAKNLYPQVPYLQKQEQLSLYFLARNNREQAKWYPQLVTWYQEIGQRLNDFKQDRTPITHTSDQDLPWIAAQLPKDLSYLLLGECHYRIDTKAQILRFIRYLHYFAQPERKIIILTEFLPENVVWEPGTPLTGDYVELEPIWAHFRQLGIPTIGLEPDFMFNDFSSNIAEKSELGKIDQLNASHTWVGSLEGVRLRNARFLKTIEQVHQDHPDALLIIYAGGAHVEYSQPYSLGDALAGPKTRVISFVPGLEWKNNSWNLEGTNFDIATSLQFVRTPIIQFNDPELIKLSGADIRWREHSPMNLRD